MIKILIRKSKFLIATCFLFLACNNKGDNLVRFKSDFNEKGPSAKVEPEYWSNTLDEWQLSVDRLECLVSKEYRGIQLLTRKIGSRSGDLVMDVELGFYNTNRASTNSNWAGFNLGAKSRLLEAGDGTIVRRGIDMGITSNGVLFIGNSSPNHKNNIVMKSLISGIILKVQIRAEHDTYGIHLSVYDKISGKLLAHIFKNKVGNKSLTGNLALISNFNDETNDPRNSIKSVWFKDWNIAGSKLILNENQTRAKHSD